MDGRRGRRDQRSAADAVATPDASTWSIGPTAAQTVVVDFLPAPTRNSPDYDALSLVDAVWGGGGFGTRLNLNLREKTRSTGTGVFSNFNPMRTAR